MEVYLKADRAEYDEQSEESTNCWHSKDTSRIIKMADGERF